MTVAQQALATGTGMSLASRLRRRNFFPKYENFAPERNNGQAGVTVTIKQVA